MSDVGPLAVAAAAGFGLGIIFFGGLWLTIRYLPRAQHPALVILGSFAGRSVIVLAGFYLVTGGAWAQILLCLAGFLAARMLLVRRLGAARTAPR